MSGWNMCGPEVRKSLLIIMERSKRPFTLTAAKFTTLSRVSLVIVSEFISFLKNSTLSNINRPITGI